MNGMNDLIGNMLCRLGTHGVKWGCPRAGRWCGRFAETVLGPKWAELIEKDRAELIERDREQHG